MRKILASYVPSLTWVISARGTLARQGKMALDRTYTGYDYPYEDGKGGSRDVRVVAVVVTASLFVIRFGTCVTGST
jgi:hypothetical protein